MKHKPSIRTIIAQLLAFAFSSPIAVPKVRSNKYSPHQGKREIARRAKR